MNVPPAPFPPEEDETERLRRALEEANRRIRELEALAHVDELTGILNRRGFLRELRRASSYCERYGVAVTLAVLDLDLFKHVNDTYGHGAGDAVLVATASFLSGHVRASDVVARIGGDEFAVILWHADEGQSVAKLATLRDEMARVEVPWRQAVLSIQASVGVAPLVPGQPVEDALELADRRLYAAKGGRKR